MAETLDNLAQLYISHSAALAARKAESVKHFEKLRTARDANEWGHWRRENPCISPWFAACERFRATFTGRPLDRYDFSYTNFCETDLSGLSFKRANFHQAILTKANLTGARLQGANFCRTDFGEAILRGANLNGSNLQAVHMLGTDLAGAKLNRCKVYGLSAWDLVFDEYTEQQQLTVRYRPRTASAGNAHSDAADREHRDADEEEVVVDGLDLAAFIYSTLNNRNIARIVDAASRKWVLILGRFTDKRKRVLEKVRDKLKEKHYIPIIFDFARPDRRDLIETLILLGGMSAFVIIDISDPRSTPLELQAIASNYGVPIFPILERDSNAFGMFPGLRKFRWVFPILHYRSTADLVSKLPARVFAPAEREAERLRKWKRRVER